jgi:uncharacterized protein YbjQ (UPF0145 family)
MSPRLAAVDTPEQPHSSFANNAMTRLWQNAPDRETGAEAVVAIRARRQQAEADAKRSGRRFWKR